ncbi:MAG: hypothetical protein HUU03_13670 [Planctomycetaceae bacterium]|nr:hypothetical protein [Planctomycetota bacterium]MCQ3951406.1 hypothetical protein [Planctomycetota bacterium]NUO17477.1 hypothetical protein [Planctomycetaceae bacterium]GIK51283.1 MAG: hypothetical protein BroJett014_02560 [Planctomycetota bacterium]HRJ77625.1 hypothetical protein [Planctomycetota bacterium]
MRQAATKNARKVTIVELKKFDEALKSVPKPPFGALVVLPGAELGLYKKAQIRASRILATHLMECGCSWITLHGGRQTDAILAQFDEAVVDYQLAGHPDAECGSSGDPNNDLEESVREAVYWGKAQYEGVLGDLLCVIVGDEPASWADKVESLVQSVEDL